MKKQYPYIGTIVLCLIGLCIVLVGFRYFNNEIGIQESKIESDIRESQKIQDDWSVEGMVSDTMAAFVFYPPDQSDHTFSVYVNRPGLSFGYFFRCGGKISAVEESIAEFTVEGYKERAYISMNSQKVDRVEIDNGNGVQVIDIDSETPFSIILPVNSGSVTFFDAEDNMVEFVKNPM